MTRLPQTHHNLSTLNPLYLLTVWETFPTPASTPSLFNLSTSTPQPSVTGTYPQKTDPTPTPSLLNK